MHNITLALWGQTEKSKLINLGVVRQERRFGSSIVLLFPGLAIPTIKSITAAVDEQVCQERRFGSSIVLLFPGLAIRQIKPITAAVDEQPPG